MSARFLLFAFFALTSACSAVAQAVSFDKKSGEFRNGDQVIAQLKKEKVKPIGNSFILTDAAGAQELMSYRLHSWNDTFGGPTEYYYTIQSAPGYQATRPNFTGSLNTFKEVGEHIATEGLLLPDGKLDEARLKEYVQRNLNSYGDYDARHLRTNDSLMKQVLIPAPPVERDMRKPVIASEIGKIGQGNTAIGFWELLERRNNSVNEDKDHVFVIKNSRGGIVCMSWIELSGARTYVFKNGARSAERKQLIDIFNHNPLSSPQNQIAYVIQLSTMLIQEGLL